MICFFFVAFFWTRILTFLIISTWVPMGLPFSYWELLGWASLFYVARWIRMRCWILGYYFGYDVFWTIDEVVLILNGFSILYPAPRREAKRKYLEAQERFAQGHTHSPKVNIPMQWLQVHARWMRVPDIILGCFDFKCLLHLIGREASKKYLEALRKIRPRSHSPQGNILMVTGTICLLIFLLNRRKIIC